MSPEWTRVSGARLWTFGGNDYYKKLYLRANLGVEFYRNTNVDSTVFFNYIESVTSTAIGFDSEFVLNEKWSTGGILQIGLISSDSYKILVQGYISYVFDEKMTFGAGYWFDYYSVNSGSTKLIETHAALETFVKYKF